MKDFFKTYKEEIIAIPIFFLALLGYHEFMYRFFPESAQFDLVSETESIIWALIKLVVYTSAAWVGVRIVFPKAFKFMIQDYKNNYEGLKDIDRRKMYMAIFFAFLITLALLS